MVFLVATKRLYMSVCPSVGPSVGWLVTLLFFGLLGATNAVYSILYTAPLHVPRSSSPSPLPPQPSLFLILDCLNHLESVKVHFSLILMKALQTDQRTDDRPMDKASYRDADASKNVPSEVRFVMGLENHAVRLRFSLEPKPLRPNFVK